MYQLVDNKLDLRKERITRRAEWNEEPWEKISVYSVQKENRRSE